MRRGVGVGLAVGGGAALGLGLGLVIHGRGLSGDLATWQSGGAPHAAGVVTVIAGGATELIGILLAAAPIPSTGPTPPVVGVHVDPSGGRVTFAIAGRW